MLDKLQKKLVNVFLFFDLMKLNRKYPKGDDYIRLKKIQEKRLHKLMKNGISDSILSGAFRQSRREAGGYSYCGGFGEAAASHQG